MKLITRQESQAVGASAEVLYRQNTNGIRDVTFSGPKALGDS